LHHAEALVPGLPLPDWLSLPETETLVKQRTNADGGEIRKALERAFRDNNIQTKGKCRQYFKMDAYVILDGFHWGKASVDWSSSSFQVRLGQKDAFEAMFPSNPPFHFQDILVFRSDVLRWFDNTPGSEAESNNAKNPGGRTKKIVWDDAFIAVIRIANGIDGISTEHGSQAQVERIMRDAFIDTNQNPPSEAKIRKQARKIMVAIAKDRN